MGANLSKAPPLPTLLILQYVYCVHFLIDKYTVRTEQYTVNVIASLLSLVSENYTNWHSLQLVATINEHLAELEGRRGRGG